MDKTITFRGMLPPGDLQSKKVVYGIMWVRIGDLKLIKSTSNTSQKIMLSFWGEATPSILQAANSENPQYNRRVEYQIRSPIVFFHRYLTDMKANTKLQVQGVGAISLDFRPFLLTVTQRSKHPFEHFKGAFQIINKGKKMGTLQIQMACNFNPDIYELDIQQNQNCKSCQCSCSQQQSSSCDCECHPEDVKKAVNLLAVKQPWKLDQIVEKVQAPKQSLIKDNRIPNSLNIQMPNDKQFYPNKYKDQMISQFLKKKSSQKMQKALVEPAISNQIADLKQQAQYAFKLRDLPKSPSPASKSPQKKISQSPANLLQKSIQQFPEFQPVLTYSNLKLQKQLGQNHQEDLSWQRKLNKQFYGEDLSANQSFKDFNKNQQPEQYKRNLSDNMMNIHAVPTPLDQKNVKMDRKLSKSNSQSSGDKPRIINVVPYQINPSLLNPSPKNELNLQNPERFVRTFLKPQVDGRQRIDLPVSNILLNLYCEVGSIKLNAPVLFHLVYKIYGNIQRNRIDYKGDSITIISPVGSEQIKLMDKLPFIIQIRDTRDKSKLLGIIKVSLEKIKDAFLLYGKINEKAVKANVMPTIIFQGQLSIMQLKGNSVGKCNINLLLGTGEQISNFLNNFKKQKIEKQSAIKTSYKQKQQKFQQKEAIDNGIQLLTSFLQFLYRNNTKIADSLLKILNHKQIKIETYSQFLQEINRLEYLPLFNFFDYKRTGAFPVKILSDSFQDFNKISRRISSNKQKAFSIWRDILNPKLFENIQNNSQFGLISKQKFMRVVEQLTNLKPFQKQTLSKISFQEYISVDQLKKQPKQTILHSSQSSPIIYGEMIGEMIRDSILDSDLQLGEVLESFNQSNRVINIQQVNRIFRKIPDTLSLWGTLVLMEYVKKISGDKTQGIMKIGYSQLCSWLLSLKQKVDKQKFKRQEEESQAKQHIINQQKLQHQQFKKKQEAEAEKLKNQEAKNNQRKEQKQMQFQNIIPEQIRKQQQYDRLQETFKQKIEKSSQPHLQNQSPSHNRNQEDANNPLITEPQQPVLPHSFEQVLYRHSFVIQGVQLNLQNPRAGQCLVSYKFPQQQQIILSKSIHIHSDKNKYEIRLLGKHSINLNIPIQKYLGDNVLKVDVNLDGKVFCTSAVPCDELLQTGTKIIGLFSAFGNEPTLIGKLKLIIKYSKDIAKQGELGQTISKEMYLPKVGFLNIEISSAVEARKLALEHKLKQQFFLSISLDAFYESSQLSCLYKPLQSKIQSSISQIVYLRDNIKLRLSSNIIEYMKNNSIRISLVAISYKNQAGSNKRNEMILGTIQIPMLSIVSGRGIHGDYAFKNRYGIFVGLARCDISYDKNKIDRAEKNIVQQSPKQKIFVLVNILEFLNLGQPIKWVSFDSSLKPEFSTPRNHISGSKIFSHLQSASLLFEIQDMYEVTYIPIQIKSSLLKKFSFDINMRPIINSLSKHKHTAFSSYFVVVGQDVQPIRVGAKVYAFRGNNIAEQFAHRLKQNSQVNVFQYLDIPKQLDNYPKMVDILRKQLKMQKPQFDEYANYVLQPKQRLNIQLFSNKIFFRLDFLQLYTQSPSELLVLAEQSTILPEQNALQIIVQNDIQILGFKDQQTLDKFKFRNLDLHRIDRNIQLYTLDDYVDVITFIRKVNRPEMESLQQQSSIGKSYKVTIGIEKAKNLESLYNGIKPNAFIRCNGLDLETDVAGRQSNPEFNQQFEFQFSPQDFSKIRKLHFEVHHKISLDESSSQEMIIGRATVDVSSALFMKDKGSSIMYSIPIIPNNSRYKGIKKPEIIIKIRAEKVQDFSSNYNQNSIEPSHMQQYSSSALKMDGSVDIDRIATIIREQPSFRGQMFQDSESQNSYSQY